MSSFNELFEPTLNGVPIIQTGSSTITAQNKQDKTENAGSDNNNVTDLGKGQQTISVSFRAINQSDINNINNILANKRKIPFVDKYKGTFQIVISSYTIIDDETHVGETKYNITATIEEQVKVVKQDIKSQVISNRDKVLDSIKLEATSNQGQTFNKDLSQGITTNNKFNALTLKGKIDNLTNNISNISNFANSDIQKAGEFISSLKSLQSNTQKLIYTPSILSTQIQTLAKSLANTFLDKRDLFKSVQNAPLLTIKDANSNSSTKNEVIRNENVINNNQNKINLYLLLDIVGTITIKNNEEANDIQDELKKRLNIIPFDDNTVIEINNSVALYIDSLQLPNVITKELKQPTNALSLAYELYGDSNRNNEFRELNQDKIKYNGYIEGTIKVLDK